jgi:sugar phosphate isomerase/epimerase
MTLALSNIAYVDPYDDEITTLIESKGISYLEVAPLKTFGAIENFDTKKIDNFVRFIDDNGLTITAFQALLFGAEELFIFKDEVNRKRLKQIIMSQLEIAGWLGVKNLVYGSPGTRKLFGKSESETLKIAYDFFKDLGEVAAGYSTSLSIEPNPTEYNNEFLRTTTECLDFVKMVDSSGLKAHIDTSTMIINGEKPDGLPLEIAEYNCHIHISEPFLSPFGVEINNSFHTDFASFLHHNMPDKLVSLEIKQCDKHLLFNAINKFVGIYGKSI